MELAVGTIVSGKVTSITKFGAFVALAGGKSGLVHISEVANTFVSDVHDFLEEGQEVQVKVLALTPDGKINLSIKQTQPRPQNHQHQGNSSYHASRPQNNMHSRPAGPRNSNHSFSRQAPAHAPVPPQEPSFEDKLKQFMTQSDSKMSELNRNRDNKRRRRK